MVMAHGVANAGSNTYKYDALGRLTEVITSDGVDTTFTYDAAGNRTVEKTVGSKVAAPSTVAATTTILHQLLLSD